MMSSNINTENVNASIETPLLNANLSPSTLVGSMNANTLTGVSNANTLEGAIGSAVIGGGIKSIYVNNHEQSVSNDIAYITLTYDMIYNLPTIPTKLSELENDEGFINSGYASEDDFTALSNNVGLIQNTIDDVVDDIEDIESDIDTINTTLINKVNQTDFNNLQTQVTTNTNNISANTSNIQANTNNITTLTNITDAQSATITSMTALIEDNSDAIGTLSNLTTTDKTNLVSAINEVKSDIPEYVSDLSNDLGFITNTDYAGTSTGGVIKVGTYESAVNSSGVLYAENLSYADYGTTYNNSFISKGTLENVITGKGLVDTNDLATKQDTLVSGTNIKTINSQSLLGSGDITITGGQATDVQINGTSITSSNVADIQTNGTYNATSNKIATMSDLPTVPTATSQLTNDSGYVTNTDYANSSTGGVVKTGSYGFNIGGIGVPYPSTVTYANYSSLPDYYFIGKGTLENVLTGKGLTDSGWQNLTLSSGVTVGSIGGTPQCRRIGKMVYIRGSVAFTASSSSKTVATIPDGYRPPTQMYKMGVTGGTRYSRMYVATGGGIGVDWIYNVNGTQVTSGSIAWYDINISYLID